MTACALPALAPIPRRKSRPDRGATGPAAPRRVLATVEVEVPVLDRETGRVAFVTEKAEAYVRDLPPVLKALPEAHRRAALDYAKAVEDVEAGGATDPEAGPTRSSPAVRKEGRQFHAVRQVSHLRRIEAAIGSGCVSLGRRRGEVAPVILTDLSVLRAVALDGLTVDSLLASLRLGNYAARRTAVIASLIGSTERIAVALGYVEPKKSHPFGKKDVDGQTGLKAGPVHGPERAPGE